MNLLNHVKLSKLTCLAFVVCFSSCSINPIAIHRAKKKETLYRETTELLLKTDYKQVKLENIEDSEIKNRMIELEATWAVIYKEERCCYGDSVVIFKRWGLPIAVVEFLYDHRTCSRDVSKEHSSWRKIGHRLYYRKTSWTIS